MMRRPPRSPPFPYTTLFRSQALLSPANPAIVEATWQLAGESAYSTTLAHLQHALDGAQGTLTQVFVQGDFRRAIPHRTVKLLHRVEFHVRAFAARAALAPDRKSTRLNSSHLGISYAVFCLKKK